jgi:hypothetical protein
MMLALQSQPTPIEFTAEQHTDFVFAVQGAFWAIAIAAIGVATLAVGLAVWWRRRRGRQEP